MAEAPGGAPAEETLPEAAPPEGPQQEQLPARPPLKIAFVAAEVAPYAKTGGLADVAGALPAYVAEPGSDQPNDVRIFMPLHKKIDAFKYPTVPVDFLQNVPIHLGQHFFRFSLRTAKLPGSAVDVYFVECPALFDRPGIYTGEWDEHLRFGLFSRAVLMSCQHMGWGPDILHCNDWHTALVPLYLRTLFSWDHLFAKTRTILTLHNMAYQGVFPADVIANLGFAEWRSLLYQEDLDRGFINFLKTGLLYADVITAVSVTYAKEIQTEAFGMGLDHVLRARSASVVGIVNGVDYGVWNPTSDPYLVRQYGSDDLREGKRANRQALMKEIGLGDEPGVPLLAVVSRLTAQKGFDLVFEPLAEALRYLNIRLIVLGSGEPALESRFFDLQRTFPHKCWFFRGYHERLAHAIEAAADIFLMPSRFEPCGLNQMYSLKYGTVPVVRKTGGLADTVELVDPLRGTGTGIVFEHYDEPAFTWALKSSLQLFQHRSLFERVQRNGMAQDFSWERQSAEYLRLYRALLGQGEYP
jgi:starch synthase